MKPTQSGVSQLASNYLCKRIDTDPCTGIIAQPTEDDLKDFLALKVYPQIEATPELCRKVRQAKRGQAGGSTTTRIMFPGGFYQGASASSPGSAQSKSVEIFVGDEVDEWPLDLGSGGDPLAQFLARLRTFGWKSKVLLFGKPKLSKYSRIAKLYEDSDRRKFFIPCAACGQQFLPTWAQVRWPEDQPHAALLHCSHCEHGHNDPQRMAACRKGEWIATNPGHKRAGFHFPSWITPWVRDLGDLAAKFIAAKRAGPEALQVFINSEMAEPFSVVGDQLNPDDFEARAEEFNAEPLPEGVVALTVGGDTQTDRVELNLIGWGPGREAWILDYFRVMGDPDGPEVWAAVDSILARRYRHPHGYTLPIAAACIDSGGHHTQAVYRFCTPRAGRRIYAVKGRGGKVPIWARMEKRRNIKERGHGHPVHIVGVDSAKESLYHALRLVAPGPRFIHLPKRAGFDRDWFDQLTAEERVEGRKGIEWNRKGSQPNEVWDTMVYALAALESQLVAGLDLDRLAAQRGALYAQRGALGGVALTPSGVYAGHQPGRRVRSAGLGG